MRMREKNFTVICPQCRTKLLTGFNIQECCVQCRKCRTTWRVSMDEKEIHLERRSEPMCSFSDKQADGDL